MTDEERIVTATRRAQQILVGFLEGGRCPIETIRRVNAVMNDAETVAAFHRLYGEEVWERSADWHDERAVQLNQQSAN